VSNSGLHPPDCRFTILCDDVRREDNGKAIIIGAYLPDVVIPSIPYNFRHMVFLQLCDWEEVGLFSLRGSLNCISQSGITQVATGLLVVNIVRRGTGVHGFAFTNLKIDKTGDYIFQTSFEGHQDKPFVDYKFQVSLSQQPQTP